MPRSFFAAARTSLRSGVAKDVGISKGVKP
jgi:hypothetical protein